VNNFLFLFSSEPVTENKFQDGVDLNCVPETETLSNAYLLEKKRLAEAQQKKHKPTRASWAKPLDDDNDVRRTTVGTESLVYIMKININNNKCGARFSYFNPLCSMLS